MIPCPVSTCDLPRRGTEGVCGACAADLRRALDDVPWIAAELDVTLSRQASNGAKGRSSETPLPYNPRATEAAYVLRSALVGWVRVLQETRPEPGPANTLAATSGWLAQRAQRLTDGVAAEEAVEEITAAVRAALRVIDRPAQSTFAGRCPECGTALYVRVNAARARCRECGTQVDVAQQREGMLAQVEDQLATPTEAARLLALLGVTTSEPSIRRWAEQGRLAARPDAQGRKRYRIGDIITAAIDGGQSKRERMTA